MTNKRFELCDDGNGKHIFNNISEGSPLDDNYLPQGYISPRQVVDKLNALNDENEQLKERLKEL